VVLKGETHSLSYERINPILSFPLPHTIKQLRTFLGVTGLCRIWILDIQPLAETFYAPSNISIWVLHNKCSQDCFLSPIKVQTKPVQLRKPMNLWPIRKPTTSGGFEIMYGHLFLLKNLPPTVSAPLADYVPYLNLFQELLRKHADQILHHPSQGPITISINPEGILFS
jgi:hypothetical protein